MSYALPAFYDARPLNNTYTYGKDSDIFSINISDVNLDSSSVIHHIRVNEAGTNLTNSTSTCTSISSGNWYCSNSVPSFGSLGGDGIKFIFYFDAKNTTGDSNSSENYYVTIDRSAPQISASFSNNSYVSGNLSLNFSITESFSGVNVNSARFFYGNTTYNSSQQSFLTTNPYTINFDTRSLLNNSTYFLFVNVSDNIGNVNTTKFTVIVENEIPTLSIIIPTTNSTLKGITYFQITASDMYSGLDLNSATYTLDSATASVPCTGTNASATCTTPLFNTSTLTDGFKTITFTIKDNGGNVKSNSTTFYSDNYPPSVSITSPTSGAVVKGLLNLTATVTDASSGIKLAQFRWENSSYGNWTNMSCSGTTCNGNLNTSTLAEGNYTLKINVTDNGDLSTTTSVSIVVDNIIPNIIIIKPDVNQKISGNFSFNITITDNYGLSGNANYSSGNSSGTLSCSQINVQSFSCNGTLNSSIFSEGPSSLGFSTVDLAGNIFSKSVNVSFDNLPPAIVSASVEPNISRVPIKFIIKGIFTDVGSSVSSATAKINLPDGKNSSSLPFSKGSSEWQVEYYATDLGRYVVEITLTDANSHSATYSNATSFFIGVSKCGDGICDPSENYCTCSQDCPSPKCKTDQTLSCKTGVPICRNNTGCGNGICESNESCSTCESDCGKCSANNTSLLNLGNIGEALNPSSTSGMLILGIVAIATAAAAFYFFWYKRPKPIYPGFKPKEPSV
ncbi:MAG: Ig-like domain-containing protein [Candidatus Aenigmatarchaeota archaeon]